MIRYARKYHGLVAAAVVLAILTQVLMPVSAVLEQKLIDNVINGDLAGFLNVLWYVVAVVLISTVACFVNTMVTKSYKVKVTQDLRSDLYDSIMRQRHASFVGKDTAECISLINNDAETVAGNYSSPVWSLIGAGFSAVVSLIIMIKYSVLLAVIAVSCSMLSFFMPIAITGKLKVKLVERTVKQADMNVQLKEALNGHEVISAFGVFDKMKNKYAEANKGLAQVSYRLEILISLLENSSVVIGKFVKFLTFFIAGFLAIRGQISVGTVILFVSLYEYFNSYVMLFAQVVPLLRSCKPVADKLFSIIEERDDSFKGMEMPSFDRELRVENLEFGYNDKAKVLDKLCLTIHKGEKLVLLGGSGCGKSTLIKLICGEYCTYNGNIYYDGAELRELDREKISDVVTVINQNTYIFNDTIRNNICLGEQFTQEELDMAVKKSGIDVFLHNISSGLDGDCGENGCKLSGGQRQRIAIARALIRGINFLILDEGVSAIDVETANRIEKDLLEIENMTLLTVTHRIKDGLNECYDRVLRMEEGRLTLQ